MPQVKRLFLSAFVLMVTACVAQAPLQTDKTPAEPAMTQIRKSVTFIRLLCNNGSQELDVRGTGFFISYPDSRMGGGQAFVYLITNRHVALCWDDKGQPMRVDSISIRLNRKLANGEIMSQDISLGPRGNIPWVLPSDKSIDLAAIPLLPSQTEFDYKIIPLNLLADSDFLKQRRVTEGESVFFAGFFYQFPGEKRMEPIVRQGIIAMMPDDPVPFLGIAERVYLADLHVFGGNSGSPAFINLGGFHGGSIIAADDYRLLGVVNGEVSEDENFNLELAATIKGTAKANSGISTIVPADQIKKLLDDPIFQQQRDNAVKTHATQK